MEYKQYSGTTHVPLVVHTFLDGAHRCVGVAFALILVINCCSLTATTQSTKRHVFDLESKCQMGVRVRVRVRVRLRVRVYGGVRACVIMMARAPKH